MGNLSSNEGGTVQNKKYKCKIQSITLYFIPEIEENFLKIGGPFTNDFVEVTWKLWRVSKTAQEGGSSRLQPYQWHKYWSFPHLVGQLVHRTCRLRLIKFGVVTFVFKLDNWPLKKYWVYETLIRPLSEGRSSGEEVQRVRGRLWRPSKGRKNTRTSILWVFLTPSKILTTVLVDVQLFSTWLKSKKKKTVLHKSHLMSTRYVINYSNIYRSVYIYF